MREIDCGTNEEPNHILKCLLQGDIDEATRLILNEDLNDAVFNFNMSNLAGICASLYNNISDADVKCRLSLVGMAIVFGNEEVIRTVLNNGASLTQPCRITCESDGLMLDQFKEVDPAYLITDLTLFHSPAKYNTYLELLRTEYGLDLSLPSLITVYEYDDPRDLDIKADDVWVFNHNEPPITASTRERSLLEVIAHELPATELDRYCKIYPDTLLPGGCLHLGKGLQLGDWERLKVLIKNGMHHRPALAGELMTPPEYQKLFTKEGRYILTSDYLHLIIAGHSSRIYVPHDIMHLGYGAMKPPVPGRDQYLAWFAAFQFMCGYEFETEKAEVPTAFYRWGLGNYVKLLKSCLEQWNHSPKPLALLARNKIRTTVPRQGFQEHIRELVPSKFLSDYILCNLQRMDDYYKVVTRPTDQEVA